MKEKQDGNKRVSAREREQKRKNKSRKTISETYTAPNAALNIE